MDDKEFLANTLERAKLYYRDPDYKKRMDEALQELLNEV